MRIDIELETTDFDRQVFSFIETTVRMGITLGIIVAANRIRDEIVGRMREQLDKPTDFTERGIQVALDTKGRDPSATVYVLPIQARYLGYQIDGGLRRAGDYATLDTGVGRGIIWRAVWHQGEIEVTPHRGPPLR